MKIITRPVPARSATEAEVPQMLSDAGTAIAALRPAKAVAGPVPGLLGRGLGGGLVGRLRGIDPDAPPAPVPTFRSARAATPQAQSTDA